MLLKHKQHFQWCWSMGTMHLQLQFKLWTKTNHNNVTLLYPDRIKCLTLEIRSLATCKNWIERIRDNRSRIKILPHTKDLDHPWQIKSTFCFLTTLMTHYRSRLTNISSQSSTSFFFKKKISNWPWCKELPSSPSFKFTIRDFFINHFTNWFSGYFLGFRTFGGSLGSPKTNSPHSHFWIAEYIYSLTSIKFNYGHTH